MSLFEVKHDEADIRILLCAKWTNHERAITEEDIKMKLGRLYPSCITTTGNPFVQKAEGKKVVYAVQHRTFDVAHDVSNALTKGLLMKKKPTEAGETTSFFITKRGYDLVTPKKKEEK